MRGTFRQGIGFDKTGQQGKIALLKMVRTAGLD
jgi:hypothetical protein